MDYIESMKELWPIRVMKRKVEADNVWIKWENSDVVRRYVLKTLLLCSFTTKTSLWHICKVQMFLCTLRRHKEE